MQPHCKPGAVPLSGHCLRSFSFPVRFHTVGLSSGGQRRPSGRRAPARLAPDCGESGGTLIGVVTARHHLPE